MQEDEAVVYNFCSELHRERKVSDATTRRRWTSSASAGVMDLIAVSGYYVLVSMTLNVDRTPVPGDGKPAVTSRCRDSTARSLRQTTRNPRQIFGSSHSATSRKIARPARKGERMRDRGLHPPNSRASSPNEAVQLEKGSGEVLMRRGCRPW